MHVEGPLTTNYFPLSHAHATPPPPRPPRWATWLLERFCAPHLLEEMRGDLEELYYERLDASGPGWRPGATCATC
jgi:hypothetical protein